MVDLIIAVVILLTVSAIASGTEAAIFAIPKGKVESFVEIKRRGATALKSIKQDMVRSITTIVIINNVANIVGSIIVGGMAARVLNNYGIGPVSGVAIFSGALTFMVIAFAEIVPKTVGERQCERISLFMAPLILLITKVAHPLIVLLNWVTAPFNRLGGGSIAVTSEAEIRALTELGKQAGVIEIDESELIHNVFQLNDVEAYDIMTPLAKVDYLEGNSSLNTLQQELVKLTHTRIPVLDGSFDKLVGVVHLRTLLFALIEGKGDCPVKDFVSEPSYIPATAAGDDLLRHFKTTKQHIAIVVDGFGTMLGVLTLEDVLEVLVGDIVDETDVERELIEIIDEDRALVYSEADGSDVNEAIGVNLEDMRIGELIIEELGRIPEEGELFIISNAEFVVIKGSPRAINCVEIRRLSIEEIPPVDEETESASLLS
jgi:CBS domain containing-hemolysin-like protein